MKLVDQLGLNAAEKKWLALELFGRAAGCYEEAGRYEQAAECWEEAGHPERAVQLLMRHKEPGQAARLLWERGRYREALECYEKSLAQAGAEDRAEQVSARLGIARSQADKNFFVSFKRNF